jgi:hypothetical protein
MDEINPIDGALEEIAKLQREIKLWRLLSFCLGCVIVCFGSVLFYLYS